MDRIAVYTCITGGYDSLKEIPKQYLEEGFDFICFTDDPDLISETWTLRKIPEELDSLTDQKKNRIIKILPNRYLKEYKSSLYVDGNIEVNGSILDFLKECSLEKCPIWLPKHPMRNCIYEEEQAVILSGKDSLSNTRPQINRYLSEGYPRNNGLTENRLIYRSHLNEDLNKTMFMWANEILKGSYRDQLSLMYCFWKTGLKYGLFDRKSIASHFKVYTKHPNDGNLKKEPSEKAEKPVDNVDIYTVDFNSSNLTNALIKSIIKNVSGLKYRIFVVDNSDRKPFKLDSDVDPSLVKILDNTDDKLIPVNFAVKYFSKVLIPANNNGSFKHCLTIQWILDNCDCDNLLLFDCDTILKRNIDFLDSKYVTIAEIGNPPTGFKRFRPFLQYFNVDMIRKFQLRYFDSNRMQGGTIPKNLHDTGAVFYEEVISRGLPYKTLEVESYVDHIRGGTYLVAKFNCSFTSRCLHRLTRNPSTIQDKLTWLNIYDIPWSDKYDKPLKSVCSDKLLVKEYAKEKLGIDIGVKTLSVWNNSSEIDWKNLPDKFVMKVNHNSGGTIICKDKSKLNVPESIQKLNRWMETDFTFQNGFESHYHWIDRKIFIEELLEDGVNDDVIDYKFLCFNGEPKFCQLISERRSSGRHLNYYDMNWNPQRQLSRKDFMANYSIVHEKPKDFELMKEYSRKLSEDFKFVRVDFYDVKGKIYLGELTFTPGVCAFEYVDPRQNLIVGNMLKI